MRPVSQQNFGIIIAYILPGFISLWGISLFSPTARRWLGSSPADSPTVSGFLYVTVASLGLGIFLNTLRRLLIDPLHHRTGIKKTNWDYSSLHDKLPAIEFLVEHQFKFYQFHANTFVASLFSCLCLASQAGRSSLVILAFLVPAELVLWCGSRDNLRNYFRRLDEVLGNLDNPSESQNPTETHQNQSAIDTLAGEK